ncbi:MAG TPA: hypothetical protein VFH08_13590 [Chitinophagaceae bacterium]|nr:hypothetical protein [Chitinophagaceae bacterium]
MTPVGHIISVTVSPGNKEVVPVVLKITGRGQLIFGSTMQDLSNHLFVIPDSEKSAQEITAELQAVPGFSKVAVVALSQPVNEREISDVRKLFAGLDWDASGVTDDQLSLFIDDKLRGQYTYYIDLGHKKNSGGTIPMRIKLLVEHPKFSPDWLIARGRTKEKIQGIEQSFDDIETRELMVEMEAKEEPEPPPPPPINLDQMTDTQIREWIRQHDRRIPSDEDIEIKRISEGIFITIMIDGKEETMIYKRTR